MGNAGNCTLDVTWRGLREISKIVNYHDDEGHAVGNGQIICISLVIEFDRSVDLAFVKARNAAYVGLAKNPIPAVHFIDKPAQCKKRFSRIGYDGKGQMR